MQIYYTILINVIRAGGSVIVDTSLSFTSLINLARLVANTKKTVTIRNASRLSYTALINVARAGDGNVIFDFYEK